MRIIFLVVVLSNVVPAWAKTGYWQEDSAFVVKDRIAFKTNTIDWALTVPNFAVDFDVVNTPYEKISVGLGAKWNWNSQHNYVPDYVFNVFDIRTDLRYYWRQQPFRTEFDRQWQKDWIKSRPKLWQRWLTRLRLFRTVENPREWLSFYAGPYLSYTSYSLKFGEVGRQGDAIGLGATLGWATPLYGYANGNALDLEFGASIGWHIDLNQRYISNVESNCYSLVGKRSVDFIYYPLISDLRVALVYRFNSIQNQHTEIDENLHIRHKGMYERDTIQNDIRAYNNAIGEIKQKVDAENRKIRERIKQTAAMDPIYRPTLLHPIILMRTIPEKFVKNDTDTVPRRTGVRTIADVKDPVLEQVRKEIDSIPGITNATIDDIFLKQYIAINDDPETKSINRALLVKNIYVALNDEIQNTNNQYIESTISVTDEFVEQVRRTNYLLNVAKPENVTYSINVSRSSLSKNDRIKWENEFKLMAIEYDNKRKMRAGTIKVLSTDSIMQVVPVDSTMQALPTDSTMQVVPVDSTMQALPTDTTLQVMPVDNAMQVMPTNSYIWQDETESYAVWLARSIVLLAQVFTKPDDIFYEYE